MLIVGKDEMLKTIQSALDCISNEDHTILIKNGIYHEKLLIDKWVHLIGESKDSTIITYDDYADKLDELGRPLETFKTYTMLILKEGVNIENLTIRNDSGSGDQVGQAVALFVNADRVNVTNCKITACQDTLLTGPIPKDAKNQENLIFKIEHEAIYRQCYVDCLIQGDVDFIFGSGNAIFINCTIVSNNLNKEINGYISAPSTEKGQLGHIFFQCKLLSDAEKGTVYLGRPWRDFANTVYINCFMGQHINKTGFAKWNDTERHLNSRFYEYGSYGPGALREKSLSKQLNDDEIELYKNCIRNL